MQPWPEMMNSKILPASLMVTDDWIHVLMITTNSFMYQEGQNLA